MLFTKHISNNTLTKVRQEIGENVVRENVPLKTHTWMKVGGPADLFYIAKTEEELSRAYVIAHQHTVPVFILGGGSNCVIRDGGIRGLVIKNMTNKITLSSIKGSKNQHGMVKSEVGLTVLSGVSMNQLVRHTIDESLKGLEDFLGLPGSVGGAIYNNSHHLTHLIGECVAGVTVVNQAGVVHTYTKEDLQFGYDYSILHKTQELILSVIFSLTPGDKKALWQQAEAALHKRRDSQPLELPSSGCMFKNLTTAQAIAHTTPNHTVSAGMLIDLAGLKGEKVGGAMVSDIHANFIVNTGNATAKDIESLVSIVSQRVLERFNVSLEKEVFFIGER